MATRSLSAVQIGSYDCDKEPAGPSPFPLLILTLIIAVIFIIKVRAEDQAPTRGANMSQEVRSALPNYLN